MSRGLPPIWIGRDHRRGGKFRKRVLVLAESTYPAPGDDAWYYNTAIPEDHISGRRRDWFRTKLVRAFLNTDRETLGQIGHFWHSVAFFNYITRPLGGAREAPTKADWDSQHQPLGERLAELEPHLLVALGFRM